jgi:CheY-like chemotaxis protein
MQFRLDLRSILSAWKQHHSPQAAFMHSDVDTRPQDSSEASAPMARDRALPGVPNASALQVLVVDDRPWNLADACELLAQWGIKPTTACDGAQAVALANDRRFDIIFMDIVMPGMDGFTATMHIREMEKREHPDRPRTPIVAYTSADAPLGDAWRRRAGIDDVMKKPCGADQMADCLVRWCSATSVPPT